MQQRRYRPGDVLDDYCPRERRITDHAIVAMIDDHIKQTRCVVCDAEHEYKDGKVPPQRRKKAPAALFSQVLDGLTGPTPPARAMTQTSGDTSGVDALDDDADLPAAVAPAVAIAAIEEPAAASMEVHAESDIRTATPDEPITATGDAPRREEGGPWRRQLRRAALPRPEGQPPPQTRPAPDFTVRQPNNARGARHGHRRGGGFAGASGNGDHGHGRFGRGGQPQGQGGGRRRRGRGGKKNN
jgi:hypothetical protein